MHYAIKTIHQLRPILQGFRKSRGMTQAMMAEHLGIRQQTYAELEANPAAASVERLLRVLRVLGVELVLSQAEAGDAAPLRPRARTKVTASQPEKASDKVREKAREKARESVREARAATGRRPREDW